MRIPFPAMALAALLGCASSQEPQLDGPIGRGTKVVTSKVEPSTLIAADGTLCNVSALRFRDTAIGDVVSCEWRQRSEGPPKYN
jgi:hypothetical protein